MIQFWGDNIPGYDSNINDPKAPFLEPYLLDNGKENSVVIVFPGGGYVKRAVHEGKPVALWLNSIGISSFVLHYRVAPYRYPYPLLDAKRAIKFVRFNSHKFNINPNRIGVLGFSAGGHLACMTATLFDYRDENLDDPVEKVSSKPDALILCYPVISFTKFHHRGSVVSLLGENPSDELRELLSGENNVSSDTPPTFIWHTADDESVPVENSLFFAQSLRRFNIPFELHIFQSGRHGLGLAENNSEVSIWIELCKNWLKKIGFIG